MSADVNTDTGVDEIRDLIYDCMAGVMPDGYAQIGIDDSQDSSKIALLHLGTGEVWMLTVQRARFEIAVSDA